MLDPVMKSKLELQQIAEITRVQVFRPEVDYVALARLIVDDLFDRGKVVIPELVKAVIMIGPLARDGTGSFWHYEKGVWINGGSMEIARRVQWILGTRYASRYEKEIVSSLKTKTPLIEGLGSKDYLNVANGMLNWKTEELVPHDPKYRSTYQLTMGWNPNATCPQVDAWIEETFEPEIHKLLWQIIGVVLYPGMGPQKIILLIGSGGNGKSTFLRLCQACLPLSAYCSVDIQQLVDDKFARYDLFGKTANIVGDMSSLSIKATEKLKQITGGDKIRGERKYFDGMYFVSEATQLSAGNKVPSASDTSYGWRRRILVVPMNRRITGKHDPTLEERLQSELEGVLVKAVRALKEVLQNGRFDEPSPDKVTSTAYKHVNDSATLFINEALEFSDSFKTPISNSNLFDRYESFCKLKKLKQESRTCLFRKIRDMGQPYVQDNKWTKIASGKRERAFAGVAFRSKE